MTNVPLYPPETFTPGEIEKLFEFRSKVIDLELTKDQLDFTFLIRWLRARNMDIERAYVMLKNNLEWRKDYQVDDIVDYIVVPEEFKKHTNFAHLGLTKEGYPIFLVPLGRMQGKTLVEKFGAENCYKYNIIQMEQFMQILRKASQEQGRQVPGFVEIFDIAGLSYRELMAKPFIDLMQKVQSMVDNNYPEVLRHVIAINAPTIFPIIFAVFKPFIAKRTLEKIDINSTDKEKWIKKMKEKFPMELIFC